LYVTYVLGSPIQWSDTKERLVLLHPRVSGVVLDPSATHLAYLIVHRGLLGGQDQCVPAGDIGVATPEGVRLTISASDVCGWACGHLRMVESCGSDTLSTRVFDAQM
jgi:hypothetical protein